ncbi:enoyl-CoA hydratase-related protein [Flavobacteriaceae bacterium]|nr:enoyl-CoA hydratase-related protein [Flavobacteriaceae bacterium]MDC1492229.1 enoyl-CoA hydratase-related protein [Flavobacteriaceae bacterium]
MNYYKKNQVEYISKFHFAFIKIEEKNNVFKITLNRPDKKNALHPQMINEIAFAMHHAHFKKSIWIVLFEANGTVFCAGADLKAMSGDVEPNDSTVPVSNKEILIGELFNTVHKPTIAVVNKDVYAGGFLILAGCLFVVANDELNFSLPEVKRGLFPMQVMASLIKVMPHRKVLGWCVRGNSISAKEGYDLGLLTHVVNEDQIESVTIKLIEEIKENSPEAISLGLEAYDHIYNTNNNHDYLFKMLTKMQLTEDAIEGLNAFKEKRKPNW